MLDVSKVTGLQLGSTSTVHFYICVNCSSVIDGTGLCDYACALDATPVKMRPKGMVRRRTVERTDVFISEETI